MTLTPMLGFFWLGISLILIELAILQFSVIWLLLVGVAALISAGILWLVPDGGWSLGSATFALSLVALAAASYRPLKRWQSQGENQGDTAIGQRATVLETITADSGKVRWSGTEWQARLDSSSADSIEAGSVEITRFEGITVWVKAC